MSFVSLGSREWTGSPGGTLSAVAISSGSPQSDEEGVPAFLWAPPSRGAAVADLGDSFTNSTMSCSALGVGGELAVVEKYTPLTRSVTLSISNDPEDMFFG